MEYGRDFQWVIGYERTPERAKKRKSEIDLVTVHELQRRALWKARTGRKTWRDSSVRNGIACTAQIGLPCGHAGHGGQLQVLFNVN